MSRSSSGRDSRKSPRRVRLTRVCRAIRWWGRRSAGPLHGGPQAVMMEPVHVELGLLAAATGYDGLAPVVHVHHELRGFLLAVSEHLLKHVRDVRIQRAGV